MRFLRPVRWVFDWRTGATFAATVLVLLVAFVIFDAAASRDRALKAATATANAAEDQRAATSRRIDMLLGEIGRLREDAEANSVRIGELLDQVNVLQEQVRQLGGQPVVVVRQSAPPAPRSPAVAPRPSPTTTVPPPATTTPPGPRRPGPPPGLCAGPLCIGGRP